MTSVLFTLGRYTPPPEGSEAPGRLASSIRRASVQLALGRRWGWRPLRLPLPLRGEGWLEVTRRSLALALAAARAPTPMPTPTPYL